MRIFWVFFWSMLAFSSWAQKSIVGQLESTELLVQGTFLGKDILNTSYFLKDRVFVLKRGTLEREYQNLSFGNLDFVDFTNPMQLCLFYKSFNTVVLLDKELALIKTMNLTEFNPQLTAGYVGMSSQNRLWVWDEVTSQLGHISLQTQIFVPLTNPFLYPIKYRFSDVNYFYWITEANQLFYSDVYGKVTYRYSLPSFEQIQILSKDKILYLTDNQLYFLDLQTAIQIPIILGEKSISRFFFNTQILSIFANLEIKNYHITLP